MGGIIRVLADNLKRLRHEKNISQTELAELCGLSLNSVARYEIGSRWPGLEAIQGMALALGVSESELFAEYKADETALQLQKVTEILSSINAKDLGGDKDLPLSRSLIAALAKAVPLDILEYLPKVNHHRWGVIRAALGMPTNKAKAKSSKGAG